MDFHLQPVPRWKILSSISFPTYCTETLKVALVERLTLVPDLVRVSDELLVAEEVLEAVDHVLAALIDHRIHLVSTIP